MKRLCLLAILVGCAADPVTETESVTEQEATVCGVGPVVKGIDVSYYQGTINWTSVKNDGVKFAFIRVSDGLNTIDSKFAANWSGSRAAGVKHGAYQFFRPGQDPIEQADLLLQKIGGKLEADDLPPVIDVEASDGQSAAVITAKVKKWVAHVKAAIGRDPIIYTGFYFWRDSVGAPDVTSSPLWHAQYSDAACPNIAPPWSKWALWQYSSTGTVAGISGNVDMNRWNGDMASLTAFLGPAATCGNSTCESGEGSLDCPEDCGPCTTIGKAGAVIDDGDSCFLGGGPAASMRHVATAGLDGDLVWTHTTEDTAEGNYGTWHLWFEEAGLYKVEVYTDGGFAQSKKAKYTVEAGAASKDVVIDQTAVDGWQSLGEFQFEAGAYQTIHLGDNTGELLADNVQMVFDGVRVTRVDPGTGSGDDQLDPPGDESSGCNARGGSGTGAGLLLALGLVLRRRRRRR
ncbi:MAG TPA: GH25 family lysozyme [Kofleriaceae bacterium]|nr:GH25 family lysozyme [Kofleriaceae bacterium]